MSNVSIEPRMIGRRLAVAIGFGRPFGDQARARGPHHHHWRIGYWTTTEWRLSLKLLTYERLLHDVPSWQKKRVVVVHPTTARAGQSRGG
jgi:hypothetical protein